MTQFNLTMPMYLEPAFSQLIKDGSFDRKDLASLKSSAAAQQGSKVQELLEIQTIDTLSRQLDLDADASLRIDKVESHPQAQSVGHALLSVSLLDDAAPAEPSVADQEWASQLETKMQKGYKPPEAEIGRYKDICERYLASRKGKPAPSPAELEWANTIQRRALAGDQPSQADMLKFRDIVARQALHVQALMARQPEPTAPPTAADLKWAAELQEKVQTKNYVPSEAEQIRFQGIARAFQKFNQPQVKK